jgi:hypothetical protein
MITALAVIRKYSQCSARHAPSSAYLPRFGNNWQQEAKKQLAESPLKAIE